MARKPNPRTYRMKQEAKAETKSKNAGVRSQERRGRPASKASAKPAPANLGRPRRSAMGTPAPKGTAVARTGGGGRAVTPKVYTGDVRNPKLGGGVARRAMGPIIEGSKVGGRSLIGRAAGAAGRMAARTAGGAVAGILTPTRMADSTVKNPFKGPVPTSRPARTAPTPTPRPSRPAAATGGRKAATAPSSAPKPAARPARAAAAPAGRAAPARRVETDKRFDAKATAAAIKAKRNKEKND